MIGEIAKDRGAAGELIRRIFRSGLSAFIAGAIVAGGGGRLAMRATSLIDRSAHGRRTEAGFRVGEVTLGGTLELVVFIGLFGGLAVLAIWTVVERWLPASPVARAGTASIAAVGIGGRIAIDGGNFDFSILDPGWAMALIFVALTATLGPMIVATEVLIDRYLSRGDHWARMWPGVVTLGAFPALIVFATLLDPDCSCLNRPIVAGGALLALAAFTVTTWVREFKGSELSSIWNRAGTVFLWVAVATGLIHLGREISHFV